MCVIVCPPLILESQDTNVSVYFNPHKPCLMVLIILYVCHPWSVPTWLLFLDLCGEWFSQLA